MDSGIGPAFRRARERHGVALSTAAEQLGVRPSFLEAIEEGRIESEATPVVAKAHIRVYARFLGFDPEAILDGKTPGTPDGAAPVAVLAGTSAPPQQPTPSWRAAQPHPAPERSAAPERAASPERATAPERAASPQPTATPPGSPPPTPPPSAPAARPPAGEPTTAPPAPAAPQHREQPAEVAAAAPAAAPPRRHGEGWQRRLEEPEEPLPLEVDYEDDESARRRLRALVILAGLIVAALLGGVLLAQILDPTPDEVQLIGDEPAAPADEVAPTPEPTPFPRVTPTPEPTPTPTPEPDPDEEAVAPPAAEGTTVQVLDGRWDGDAYDEVVDYLTELGYTVTAFGRSGRRYEETTIFFTDGNEELAEELAAFDPRFTVVAENDRGLAETIDLHVVVGDDWPEQ